jgi:molybdenum cofactor cytidylyltransferase
MGTLKLTLPLGSKSVLERVLGALGASGVFETIVVLGPRSSPAATLVAPPAQLLLLEQETPDMRATVEAGLAQLQRTHSPTDRDGFLLVLADQPALKAEWIDRLIAQRADRPQEILVPTFRGKRGHPVLFPWRMVDRLRRLPADAGINRLLRDEAPSVFESPVCDPDVLADLDEPGDYDAARRRRWD